MSGPETKCSQGVLPGSLIAQVGSGRLQVELSLMPVGRDWLLVITGGEAHAGAVALAGPADRGADLARGVHKEGPVAREGAAIIAAATGRACASVAGIHQENATREEIAALVEHVRLGARALAAQVSGSGQR